MSPVTIPAVEWFFGQQSVSLDHLYGKWSLTVGNRLDLDRHFRVTGPDPIELIEAAYEELYLAPARKAIREEEP